jgi:ABC-type uncharacterized transport system involved in gliding motility auxiliary subunit
MSKLGTFLLFFGIVLVGAGFVAIRALGGSNLMPFVWVLLGGGLASWVAMLFVDMRFFLELATQRTTKHGLNLGALVIIVAVVLGMVNFIGFKHPKKLDYTKEGLHSLSDQSKSIVKALDSDLEVKGYFVDNQQEGSNEKSKFKDVSDLFMAQSSKLKVVTINPMKFPEKAKEDNVTASGTVVLKYKGRTSKFEDLTEQGFTNAIIKVTRDKNKIIYYVQGHGERDFDGTEPTQLQNFKKDLTEASYDLKPLSFAEKQKVPEDAALVIIAGPTQAYFDPEIDALQNYVYGGGKVFVALDPGTKTNLGKFVHTMGIDFENKYILDPLGQLVGGGGATAVGLNYSKSSDITKGFRQNMTVFHLASPLKVSKDKAPAIATDEIVKSSPASFSKAEIREGEVKFNEGKDEKGPLPIMISAKGKLPAITGKAEPKEFEAVVVGDSDFLSNQLINFQLNHDLALNTVSYLAADKELVSIRPKQSEGSSLAMTQVQATVLYYGLVFVFPILIFLTGGTFWYRRRTV